LELREALAVADPESFQGLRELAQSHERIAALNYRLSLLAEALKHATKNLELRKEFANADPHDAQVQRDLAMAYMRLGDPQSQLGDVVAARENYRRSLEIARRLRAAHPEDIHFATNELAVIYHNQGRNEELNARDYEAAAKCYQRGYDILDEFEAEGKLKDQPRFQDLLAKTRHRLSVCRASGQAINSLEFALAQPPAEAAELLFIRTAVLASRGQLVLAAEAAERLRALDPKNAGFLYDAACGYALCVASVGQRKSAAQLTAEEAAARKRYAACAIETLSTAVQFGYKDVGKIESDIDFAAIRQEEGYRVLIARLRESLKRSKEK
jgi:tetratricopeptide (TPR) repeat protein